MDASIILATSLSARDSPLYPILGNPAFPPGMELSEYETLASTGRDRASHFLEDNQWPSIQSLTSDTGHFGLPFWKAIWLHHFLHSIANPAKFNRTLMTFEDYCRDEEVLPQVLSKTYAMLNSPSEQPDMSFIQKWETDLQCSFTDAKKNLLLHSP